MHLEKLICNLNTYSCNFFMGDCYNFLVRFQVFLSKKNFFM